MKQIEAKIMGQSYRLGCPEGGEERLLNAAARLDTAMCRIRDAGKIKARDRIAVLAALNLAFDLTACESSLVSAQAQAEAQKTATDTCADERLSALLKRLDVALGRDGHLL